METNKCPWCGGWSGYKTISTVAYTQLSDWDGEPIDSEQGGRLTGGKIGECVDCGRRFRISTLDAIFKEPHDA